MNDPTKTELKKKHHEEAQKRSAGKAVEQIFERAFALDRIC